MSGHRPFNTIKRTRNADPLTRAHMDSYKKAMRAAIELAKIREDVNVTQAELAQSMHVSQPNISRIENANDLYLSTLNSYVTALGGHLELRAVFPDRTIPLTISD